METGNGMSLRKENAYYLKDNSAVKLEVQCLRFNVKTASVTCKL